MGSRRSIKDTVHRAGLSLTLLTIIWLALGAHSIHPLCHHHQARHTALHATAPSGMAASRDAADAGLSVTGEEHNHSCPVCEFLKTCHLTLPRSSDLFIAADFSSLQVSILPITLPTDERRDSPIRGPPLAGSGRNLC